MRIIENGIRHVLLIFNTNRVQIENLLLDINTYKSCGHDMIPPRLIKESVTVIAEPLAKIMNTSIDLCYYPAQWKMGHVTPLFNQRLKCSASAEFNL